ncbi:MAG: hypothetical protein GWN82_03190 [Gemmatimonadetes bacterium]|nr:hypothetical protein [Gemmatimonadota bacterium]NIT85937.1 hypothetical protein [Gemmatimonadota bacterium]NIU29757.1 hypothetical protein [Gemmatimonadota bacterium]NIW62827.1 hypothetical protein [Gemmatimonadota bacterium]
MPEWIVGTLVGTFVGFAIKVERWGEVPLGAPSGALPSRSKAGLTLSLGIPF